MVVGYLHPPVPVLHYGINLPPEKLFDRVIDVCKGGGILEHDCEGCRDDGHHFLPLFKGLEERGSEAEVAEESSVAKQLNRHVDCIRECDAQGLFHTVFELRSIG